jgi:ActR/RegA family two-component response regulator
MHTTTQITTTPALARPQTTLCATDALNCLVVAAETGRRENLGFAAREGGWQVTLCADSATAISQASHALTQLAIVDLTGATESQLATFRFMVEHLACGSRMLLLICGKLDDPKEEIWARHLGVWMYLPGAIDGSDLVGLCSAAREAVERLNTVDRQRAKKKS